MVKCSTSLWSADLASLEAEIKRVEPFSERFHLDVADGHYTSTLLFFPDLVRAIRPHTERPLEVHLMTTDPLAWIDPFLDAGADGIIFSFDTLEEPGDTLRQVRARGKMAAVAIKLDEPVSVLEPYWNDLDMVTIIGTQIGIKGVSMDPSVPDKIREARNQIQQRGANTEIQSDGGIRRETVPLLHAAGVDYIVPGSLMFKEDPAEMRQWLASL